MTSASSSTFRAARKLIVDGPTVHFERRWTRALLHGNQHQRSYNTERPASEKPRRQPPQPVPTATQLKPRTNRFPQNPQIKASSTDDSEGPKRFLEPYVLSKRLISLSSQGRLDEAVDMLQNSPLDASNVTTWNTLLLHCMMGKRFKLGYKLFTDMKRRGFKPNVRTYNVLLSGLSRIENWEEHKVQFKNAQALWQGFLQRIEQLKKINPEHKEIRSNPAAFYISILTANKDYNAVFDVLNDLDEEGPFSPTEFIYAKMFQGIAYRTQLAPGDKENVTYRNASDAKLLWKDLTKRATKNLELVSSPIILYLIKALMKGRPADQLYAFDVIHDYLGLSKPGEEAPPRRVEIAPMTLDAVLLLCLTTQKHRLCIHYVQQTIDEAIANDRKPVIDHGHMEKVLRSYSAMTIAGSVGESDRAVETIEWMHQYHALGWDVKPRASTYGWGLMSCWRGGDWASAARITELMTGCHAEDFVDDSQTSSSPRLDDRTQGRMIVPDARDMSCLLRAALASGEVANMRQCLRMATFFGELKTSSGTKYMDVYLAQGRLFDDTTKSTVSKREEPFYSTKVASTLANVLTRVLEGTDPAVDTSEMKTWRGLRARAKKILRESTKPEVETPDSELEPLGSAGGLEATERFVDYDLATRSQKPSRTTRR
ncbi:hypothetical protein BDM02DRAFT_978609 [Thelephora ganbajun]|uniref:Uncharacterized protein n=1 Tax=Thelephora ganbajun TaxID=370292 RepID=A0ACB6ZNZ7_THEGA|nr:hypothetical protein BDM02DRAFT_978609 [Thelephora ganbajun]